ncbi:MAG: PDZ domain-containing protein, partial [Alphaproteobacteria bacterium]
MACVQFSDTGPRQWSTQYANAVIGEAFDTIEERYIEPITLEQLATDGLAGIKTIDPNLEFDFALQSLTVSHKGTVAGAVVAPAYDNSEAWTSVTVSAIELARSVSPLLRDADAEAIVRAVLDGALSPLDPFSRYADAVTANDHRALRDGFGGIGISIRMERDHARVLSVNDEGPAREAGLQPQDQVVAVDGKPIAGWSQRELVHALRGYVGTPVALSIVRDGRPLPAPV